MELPLLLLGGAAILLLLTNSDSGSIDVASITEDLTAAVAYGSEQAFIAAIPANIAQYSTEILNAARSYNVSPWLLGGILYQESYGGSVLTPPGPTGTGDFSKRTPGRNYGNGYVVGASGLPEDGQGWGRGLMQLDWAAQYPWAQNNPWQDPQTNINKGALVLQAALNYFSSPGSPLGVSIDSWRMNGLASANVQGWASKYGLDPSALGPYNDPRPLSGTDLALAALAAYNAGTGGVLQALAAGLPADAPTAGNTYASRIAGKVVAWLSNFG